MTPASRSTLPKPFGDSVPSEEWRRLFLLIRKASSALNLFNGTRDISRELGSFMVTGSDSIDLIVDEFPPSFADRGSNPLVLVRAQYFESGLHHRISFHASLKARLSFEDSPSCMLSIMPPIRRVSNLYVAYPSEDKPLFLEIPIAGAPPDVRVVEFSMGELKAYNPKTNRLLPETKYIQDMRLQFVDLGETLVSGKAIQTGDTEITIKLDPLSSNAHKLSEAFLQQSFNQQVLAKPAPPPAPETAAKQSEDLALKNKKLAQRIEDEAKAGKKCALIVSNNPLQASRLESMLEEFGWDCDIMKDFEEVRSLKTFGRHELLVLDAWQGSRHAIDLLRSLVRDEVFAPTQFIVLGDKAGDAHEVDWEGLGRGLFLRMGLPDTWLRTKLKRWFEDAVKEGKEVHLDSRLMILVVDDDAELRNLVGSMLTMHEYRVVTAENGVEAIRSLRNLRPDLVLLDLEMPGRTGLEVLRMVRAFQVFKHLPVIIVSGRRDTDALEESMKLGVNDYLVKPFNDISLLNRVRVALENRTIPPPAPPHK